MKIARWKRLPSPRWDPRYVLLVTGNAGSFTAGIRLGYLLPGYVYRATVNDIVWLRGSRLRLTGRAALAAWDREIEELFPCYGKTEELSYCLLQLCAKRERLREGPVFTLLLPVFRRLLGRDRPPFPEVVEDLAA